MLKKISTAIIGVITLNSCNSEEDGIWMKIKDVYCEQVYCSSSIFETVFLGIFCLGFMGGCFGLIIKDLTTEPEKYRFKFENYFLSREKIGFFQRYQDLFLGAISLVFALFFWIEQEYKNLGQTFFLGLICSTFSFILFRVFLIIFWTDFLEKPFKKIKTYIVRRIFKNKRKLNKEDLEAELPQFKQGKLAETLEEDIDEEERISREEAKARLKKEADDLLDEFFALSEENTSNKDQKDNINQNKNNE